MRFLALLFIVLTLLPACGTIRLRGRAITIGQGRAMRMTNGISVDRSIEAVTGKSLTQFDVEITIYSGTLRQQIELQELLPPGTQLVSTANTTLPIFQNGRSVYVQIDSLLPGQTVFTYRVETKFMPYNVRHINGGFRYGFSATAPADTVANSVAQAAEVPVSDARPRQQSRIARRAARRSGFRTTGYTAMRPGRGVRVTYNSAQKMQ